MSGLGHDQEVSPEAVLAYGRRVLASQPFSALIGTQLHALAPGLAELQLPLTAQLKQQNGFAHGGIVSYMADNALTFAGGSALRVPVVTSEFKINYVRPALGDRLIARATTAHCGSSQAVCTCEVFVVNDNVEKLCALAQGTIAKLPDSPKK
ncbi:PaaI family thioesterase [Variovorax sp. ZT5P49]|uniref:PaaI family thioesterase n=1 Tax=Variovorax sp. ZT5P49 TaxID=3443733 RepID=UPI003F4468AB